MKKIYAIYLPNLLEKLGYTIEEFRDLCILLKCDYNKYDANGEKTKIEGYLPNKKPGKK